MTHEIYPTGIRGKLTALGLLIVLIGSFTKIVVIPLVANYINLTESVKEAQFEAEKLSILVSNKQILQEQLDELAQQNSTDKFIYSGSSPHIASARMQTQLTNYVRKVQGKILSTRILPKDESEHLDILTISSRIQVSHLGLVNLLEAIEFSEPLMFITQLNVSSPTASSRTKKDSLDLRIKLHSFWHKLEPVEE